MSKHTLTHSNCPACAEEFGMMQHQLHTLRAQNRDLLAALEAMTPDYEHCAPDMGGDIEPDRLALIKQARAAIAGEEAFNARKETA